MGFSSFAYQSQNQPVTTGLVLYYDVNNASSYPGSGTNLTDLSTSALNSTLTNGPTFSSNNGGTIVFDGTNDYTTRAANSAFNFGTGDFTIEMWVKINGNSATNNDGVRDATITCCFPLFPATLPNTWAFTITGNASTTGTGLLFGCRNAGGTFQTPSLTYTFTQSRFYQIGISRFGGATYFFVDGKLFNASSNLTNDVQTASNPYLQGGLRYQGYLQYFNGTIGIVRIYKGKGLNAAEVQQNYNSAYRRI
jgi:hypothetical protein